jgi:hypothetical protein
VNDRQLIEYCERLCKGKGLFAGDRVNRMIELAGKPKWIAPVAKGAIHAMRQEMELLIGLAKKRLERPAGGLKIEIGRAYRDVNGEVRQVVDMPPHHRSFGVKWVSATDSGQMRLEAFREWAMEEVKP